MEIKMKILLAAVFPMLFACGKMDDPDTPQPAEPVTPPEPELEWTELNESLAKSETLVIEQPDGTFMKGYWPDGKLIPVKNGDQWQLFWGEATDALTTAATPYPEDHISLLTDGSKNWGKEFSRIDGFNDGGSWFIGIFPQGAPGHYVGFFHAESHWPGDGIAYKSIGVVYSDDYGVSWHDPRPIIMDETPKPEIPEWTGLGDACVVWDSAASRYICYYQAKTTIGTNALCMASSSDKEGAPGTWKKWDGSGFTLEALDSETGLGGKNVAIANLRRIPGANPSVMWNGFLEKWVMVYASWKKSVYISYSADGTNWDAPVKILGDGATAWYPNLIGPDGDLSGGEVVNLYWSDSQNEIGVRNMAYCKIKFIK